MTIIKRFESADEIKSFPQGKFETVKIGDMILGRASYEPGWKWSQHVGPKLGEELCTVRHIGIVLCGKAAVEFTDGRVIELAEGDVFDIPPEPHDSWVIGDRPYVSLHLVGADEYA